MDDIDKWLEDERRPLGICGGLVTAALGADEMCPVWDSPLYY